MHMIFKYSCSTSSWSLQASIDRFNVGTSRARRVGSKLQVYVLKFDILAWEQFATP